MDKTTMLMSPAAGTAMGRTSSSAPASAPLQKQITDLYDRLAATTEGSPEQNSVYAELDRLIFGV
jgi:hypothetical protein